MIFVCFVPPRRAGLLVSAEPLRVQRDRAHQRKETFHEQAGDAWDVALQIVALRQQARLYACCGKTSTPSCTPWPRAKFAPPAGTGIGCCTPATTSPSVSDSAAPMPRVVRFRGWIRSSKCRRFGGDFAPKLLAAISNALLPRLPARYDVRIEEHLVVTHEEERLHRVQPDGVVAAPAVAHRCYPPAARKPRSGTRSAGRVPVGPRASAV